MDNDAHPNRLPPSTRAKLHKLFSMIEKEFESLYLENASLQDRLDTLTEKVDRESLGTHYGGLLDEADGSASARSGLSSTTSSKVFSSSGRLKSHTNKLKYQTTKIMSGLKAAQSAISANPVKRYSEHRDGVWEVCVSRLGLPVLGTASADQTARIWGMHSGTCLLQYHGHNGSVNSIRFHPCKELVLTTSGDGTAHIWQCAVSLHNESSSGRVASSEDELEFCEMEQYSDTENTSSQIPTLRTPLQTLTGHTGVVISGDWLSGGEQVITGGWDRLATIWDAHSGQCVQQLAGHDDELTYCATHPSQRLVVTASKDSTFRLWDFRETIHAVSVFQGHQESVSSAVFVHNTDLIVSGSDDRSIKVWDLRNMRTAVASVNSDSSVNKLSVSGNNLIAVPYDNRNVRIFDLAGSRLARLARSSHQGHSRMVTATAWSSDSCLRPNLFTCGFDRQVIGWSVEPREIQEEKEGFRLNLSLRGRDMSSMKEK